MAKSRNKTYPVGVVAEGDPTFLPSKLAKCDSRASNKLLGAWNGNELTYNNKFCENGNMKWDQERFYFEIL